MVEWTEEKIQKYQEISFEWWKRVFAWANISNEGIDTILYKGVPRLLSLDQK